MRKVLLREFEVGCITFVSIVNSLPLFSSGPQLLRDSSGGAGGEFHAHFIQRRLLGLTAARLVFRYGR